MIGGPHLELAQRPEPHERAPRGGRTGGGDDAISPLVYADGLAPLRPVGAQVFEAQVTTPSGHLGDHGLAELAAVDDPGAPVGYEPERTGEVLLQVVPRPRAGPVPTVDRLRVGGEGTVLRAEPAGKLIADDEAVLGVPNGRIEETAPLQVSILFGHCGPGVQVAGRRDDRSTAPVLLVVRGRRAKDRGIQRRRVLLSTSRKRVCPFPVS